LRAASDRLVFGAAVPVPGDAARPRPRRRRDLLATVTWAVACVALLCSTASTLFFAREARRSRAQLTTLLEHVPGVAHH
jgi:hypothetical protein